MNAGRLYRELAKVCPVLMDSVRVGRSADRATWEYTPAPGATAQQIADAVTLVNTVDDSPGAEQKELSKAVYDSTHAELRLLRAVVKLVVDELNVLRAWVTTFKAEVAAATNLANLQTRVANNTPNLAQRAYAQAKTAIETLIDGE